MNLNLTLISGEEMRAASAFITLLADIRDGETKDGAILGAIIQKGLGHVDQHVQEVAAQAQTEADQAVVQAQAEAVEPVKEATKRPRKPSSESKRAQETVLAKVNGEQVQATVEGGTVTLDKAPTENLTLETAAEPTIDDVRAALQRYTAVHGMQDGIVLLKNYGAGRISELTEEQYPLFIAECDAKDE